jgi:hypothetical protein
MKDLLRKFRLALLAIAVGIIAGPAYIGFLTAYGWFRGDILNHLAVSEASPGQVLTDGAIFVTVQYHKRADCPGTWSYFVRWSGQSEWELLRSGPTGANAPGTYAFRHVINIPRHAPAGPAEWREVVTMSCGTYWTSISRSPAVPFEVQQAPAVAPASRG